MDFWKWSLFDPNEAGGQCFLCSDLPLAAIMSRNARPTAPISFRDQKYPVVFEYAGQETALVQILVNEGKAVSNELLHGRVDGVKVGENPEGGEDVKLAGALMGLFRPDTEEFTEENALLTKGYRKSQFFLLRIFLTDTGSSESRPDLYTVSPQQHHLYIGGRTAY